MSRIKIHFHAVALACCAFCSISFAQDINVFYVGHSLSDQIPDMVKSLADNAGQVAFDWAYQGIPGSPLRWHWDRMAANDYEGNPPHYYGFYDPVGGLAAGDFTDFVMVEAVPRHWGDSGSGIQETHHYAGLFLDYAQSNNPNVRVFLYEPWHCIQSGTPTGCDYDVDSNPWRQRLTDDLPMWESAVRHLNTQHTPAHPVRLIPGGQGLARLNDAIDQGRVPGLGSIEDVFSDDIHLTDVGKYYVACIHYAVLLGASPVGLTNQLQVWWGGNFDAPTPEQAAVFQQLAWETVNAYEQRLDMLAWMAGHGIVNPTNAVEKLDLDGDGFSIEQEWIADTDPTNAASFFPRLAFVPVDGNFILAINPTSSRRRYHVEGATHLLDGNWTSLTSAPGDGGEWSFAPNAIGDAPPYFRGRVALP
jgi:hypothetical protein